MVRMELTNKMDVLKLYKCNIEVIKETGTIPQKPGLT
jgi:hypothetical protein